MAHFNGTNGTKHIAYIYLTLHHIHHLINQIFVSSLKWHRLAYCGCNKVQDLCASQPAIELNFQCSHNRVLWVENSGFSKGWWWSARTTVCSNNCNFWQMCTSFAIFPSSSSHLQHGLPYPFPFPFPFTLQYAFGPALDIYVLIYAHTAGPKNPSNIS